MDKNNLKGFAKNIEKNKKIYIKELCQHWENNKWTDVCLDEYVAYKAWVISRGEDFFVELKKEIQEIENKTYPISTIKHDSWIMYLDSLGMHNKSFLDEFYDKLAQNLITQSMEGGLA